MSSLKAFTCNTDTVSTGINKLMTELTIKTRKQPIKTGFSVQ